MFAKRVEQAPDTSWVGDVIEKAKGAAIEQAAKVVEPAVVVEKSADPAGDVLKDIEDKLYGRAMEVVSGVLDYAEIDPESPGCPQEWIASMGREAAMKRYRMALSGNLGAKEAPAAIKAALGVVTAIARMRMKEESGPKTLAISFVQMTAPPTAFPRRIVEQNEDK